MRSKTLLTILFVFVAGCAGCKPTDETCTLAQDGASCSDPAQCCSGKCANNVCVKDACASNGTTCGTAADCCTGECDGTCIAPCSLANLGDTCKADGECCSGKCAPNGICIIPLCHPAPSGTCTAPSDCCTGDCDATGHCYDKQCPPDPDSCGLDSQCCYGQCVNSNCLGPSPGDWGADCTADRDCKTGYCSTTSPRKCDYPPAQGTCVPNGLACPTTGAAGCCNKACTTTNQCTGKCEDTNELCDRNEDCCSFRCSDPGGAGATCLPGPCKQSGAQCTSPDECCSSICTSNQCAPVPPGSGPTASCHTLGESCTLKTDCCSTNCQSGVCRPPGPCNARNDICTGPNDCCSHICNDASGHPIFEPVPGQVGRCGDSPGDCTQSGLPCEGSSRCCTEKCADIGYGTTVCKVPSGCVMTGDFCDSTASCCGGTNEVDPALQPDYGIFCDLAGGLNPAQWDTSTSDTLTCSRGQACNPTGNACGDGASWDCCDGKKDVCRYDDNGIRRCYGRPPCCSLKPVPSDCPTQCCGTGWTGEPPCCKDAGDICEFREQCCDGRPCVPDANKILRCTGNTCIQNGLECDPNNPDCCQSETQPLSCQNVEGRWLCGPPPLTCELNAGDACTEGAAAPACCKSPNSCLGGQCRPCAVDAGYCETDNWCCSPRQCETELLQCFGPCQAEGTICTSTTDCCSGLECDKPLNQTSGKCVKSGCAVTSQPCGSSVPCCNATDACIGGYCQDTACLRPSEPGCTAGGNECCSPEVCYEQDQYGAIQGLCPTGGSCVCKNQCVTSGSCTIDTPCCFGSGSCIDGTTFQACTRNSTACTCTGTGG